MKMFKLCEDINPWTSRIGQTFFEASTPPKSKHLALKQTDPTKESNKPSRNYGYPRRGISPLPNSPDQIDPLYGCNIRIPSRSQQILIQPKIHKMPIRHKFIRFELQKKSDQQKRKEKHLPFTPNNLKQYTQEMPINSRSILSPQLDSKRYQKILKVKRYFTEQKDYFDYQSKDYMRKNEITQIKTETMIKSVQQSLILENEQVMKKIAVGFKMAKRARVKKQILTPDDITKHQKLYQQIRNICVSNSNSITGHLSLMKRNYNLQKLQRILKNQQSLQIRVSND